MESNRKTVIEKDLENQKLTITRDFKAPVAQVWKAWTNSELLDLWWAPKPWKANTKTMDFREGGIWLYAMVGPDGTTHWARADYQTIKPQDSFRAIDSFCDEEGNMNNELPSMHWQCNFQETPTGTRVNIDITFSSKADLEKIIQMGFAEGFTAALTNLDELIEQNNLVVI
jgi:uncharacterized protein YndB with AHSA1/START domain